MFTRLLLTALLFCVSSGYVHAAPLEELITSPEYRGAVRGAKRLKLPAWVSPDSNYVQLFEGTGPKTKIVKLLGEGYEGFRVTGARLHKKDEFIVASKTFAPYQSKNGIVVSLAVPHPAYLDLVRDRLVMDFEALRPKPSTILSDDAVTIQEDAGRLIACRDGSTVVMIPLPMEAMIIARAVNAKDAKAMTKLVELMNLGEIKRNLTS